nr:unnamed protein product [Digitaria exilis]
MPATSAAAAVTTFVAPRPRRPLLLSPCRRAFAAHGETTGTRRPRAVASASASGAAPGRRGVTEYVEAAREMARRKDGGPPRWLSPLECGGAAAGGERVPGAPTLLYLPVKDITFRTH